MENSFHFECKWIPKEDLWQTVRSFREEYWPNEPSIRDLGRLKQSSTKIAATPVVANVTTEGIKYRSARSGRTLKPPTRRK